MRRLFRMVLSVATVFWVVGLSAPAWGRVRAAVGPTIAASPSTDLVGQQTVQVTGQNWGARVEVAVWTVYLDYDGTQVINRYYSLNTNTTTAGDGSFSLPVKVKRIIEGHDCAKLVDPNDKCILEASDPPNVNNVVRIDISFRPK